MLKNGLICTDRPYRKIGLLLYSTGTICTWEGRAQFGGGTRFEDEGRKALRFPREEMLKGRLEVDFMPSFSSHEVFPMHHGLPWKTHQRRRQRTVCDLLAVTVDLHGGGVGGVEA